MIPARRFLLQNVLKFLFCETNNCVASRMPLNISILSTSVIPSPYDIFTYIIFKRIFHQL